MEKIAKPRCLISNKQFEYVCIHPQCNQSAFICKSCPDNTCEKLHKHNQEYNLIESDQIDQLILRLQMQGLQKQWQIQHIKTQMQLLIEMLRMSFKNYQQAIKQLKYKLNGLKYQKALNKIQYGKFDNIKGKEINILVQPLLKNKDNQKSKQRQITKKFKQLLNSIRLNINKYSGIKIENIQINKQIKLSSLEKLIKSKCRSKTSRYNQIGKLYQKYGQQTIANYTKAIEYDNTYAISYYNRAKLYSNKEQEKALDDYTMAIQLGITGPKVYQLRGYIYYKQNQFQLALKDANKVIQLDKNNSFGYYLKGIIYENKKLLKQAIHNYSKLIQCDELYQAAYIRRGSTYFQTDECQKALLDFNEIILLLFQFEIKKNNQKIFYLNKGSIEKFDQVYSMTHLQMYFNRGLLDKKIRFIKRALDDFNFVLSQNPQRFKIYVERSEIYYQLGDMRSLQIDLKRAQQGLLKNVQSNIQIEFSYLYLGRIYLMRKDYQKSKEYFTKSIQINPNQDSYIYRGIVNNLLQAYEEQDQDYQAIFNSQRNG